MMMIMMDYDHNITEQECALNIVAIGVVACYSFFLRSIHKSISNWSSIKIAMDYIRAHTHLHTHTMFSVCRPIPSDHTVTSLINQSTHEREIKKT